MIACVSLLAAVVAELISPAISGGDFFIYQLPELVGRALFPFAAASVFALFVRGVAGTIVGIIVVIVLTGLACFGRQTLL